jgi:PAS domain S-box-containing protein
MVGRASRSVKVAHAAGPEGGAAVIPGIPAAADTGAEPNPAGGDADVAAAPHPTTLGAGRVVNRLLDQSSQPFVVADFAGRLVHVNRAFEELVGYPAAEIVGLMKFRDLTPEAWLAATDATLERLLATGKAQRYEKAYRHRDGREIPIELVVDLFRDERDQPIGTYAFITDIGERKRAEARLRESEERFRRLYDEAPFGYHEIDPHGTILMVNRTECELLGYAREEMLGRKIWEFVVESQRELSRQAIRDRVEGGSAAVLSVERTYRTKDGRELILAIENRLTRDAAGLVTSIRSTVQDVTWRTQAEVALVTSERRARALFEGIEDAVFVHDGEGHILDANPAACRRLGYTREEMLRLTTKDIDDPSFAVGFPDRLEQQLKLGHLRIEGRHRTKAGRVIPVDINTSTIQLEDQPAVLAVIRDITERKALEETRRQFAETQLKNAWEMEAKNRQLVQSEERYRQLTEGCLDAIVVTDGDGRITLFNPAAERAFGWASAEVVGRPFVELLAEEARPAFARELEGYVARREGTLVGRTVELCGRRAGGEAFPMEVSLGAVELAGSLQFMAAIRDQAERQRMRAMLAQSERLASLGWLAAGVAHEINNPLAYIGNNLAVLERDYKGIRAMLDAYEAARDVLAREAPAVLGRVDAAAEELDWGYVRENLPRMLNRTQDGVQRVANIVQNLRGLARTTPPKLEPALLADLVAGAVEMVQGRIRRHHIEIRVDNRAEGKILCLPPQVGQVILNLLINAIQAIEATERVEGNAVDIAIRQEAEAQVIEFRDNGCGIAEAELPHLFDPFYTTKPVGEGTGLGLAISHGIIAGHGGRIEVESTPGVGACFRVVLPWKRA